MIVRKCSSFIGMTVIAGLLFFASTGLFAQEQLGLNPEVVQNEEQKNTDYLLAEAIKKAKELMERNGDFLPFGAGLFGSGDVRFVWAQNPDEEAKVPPAIALAAVKRALQANAQRGRVLGTAVVYLYSPTDEDGKPLEPQVNVEIEYITGYAFVAAFDYALEDGVFTPGKGVRREIDGHLFEGEPAGEVVPPGQAAAAEANQPSGDATG